jgi:hypothetical protein
MAKIPRAYSGSKRGGKRRGDCEKMIYIPTLTAVFVSSSEYRVAAPCLLLTLILEDERGRVAGRITALRGRCIVFAFGEVGGEEVAILLCFALRARAGQRGGTRQRRRATDD